MDRIVIIGNSGSGKSYLADRLSALLSIPRIDLDVLFWEPGGFHSKRPTALVQQDIADIRQRKQWVVEGVYGELAALFLDRAEALIWLDVDWNSCQSNLVQRGPESAHQQDPLLADKTYQKLLTWASQYWTRGDGRSYSGHKTLFDAFRKAKWMLHTRNEVNTLLKDLSGLK